MTKALRYAGAAGALVNKDLPIEKTIVIVRHGLATWSAAGRIQAGTLVLMTWIYFRHCSHWAKVATVASNLGLWAYFNRHPSKNLASYFAGRCSFR